MLQLTKFYEKCYLDFREKNPGQLKVSDLFNEINELRKNYAQKNMLYFLDHLIWTSRPEHLDDPDFNVELKKEIIHGLHLKNTICKTYKKTIEILRPLIEKINEEQKRPAKILELASGSGKLTMAIYEEFQLSSLKVELTGSDIVPEYVQEGNLEALQRGYEIDFKVIDACRLEQLKEDAFDIIFTLHSMHHFSPHELSKVMAGSQKAASTAFIGIDGYRGFGNLLFMFLIGAGKSLISANSIFLHDSFISGRKMYSAKQLEIMARLSCPGSSIRTKNLRPGLTYIKVQNPMFS